jgi:hypothetical protein
VQGRGIERRCTGEERANAAGGCRTTCCGREERTWRMSLRHGRGGGGRGGHARLGETGRQGKKKKWRAEDGGMAESSAGIVDSE